MSAFFCENPNLWMFESFCSGHLYQEYSCSELGKKSLWQTKNKPYHVWSCSWGRRVEVSKFSSVPPVFLGFCTEKCSLQYNRCHQLCGWYSWEICSSDHVCICRKCLQSYWQEISCGRDTEGLKFQDRDNQALCWVCTPDPSWSVDQPGLMFCQKHSKNWLICSKRVPSAYWKIGCHGYSP